MEMRIFSPSACLRPFVDYYKIIRASKQQSSPLLLRGYPSGYTDLLISLGSGPLMQWPSGKSEELSGVSFIGHFERGFQVELPQTIDAIWVRMKPHGIYALTGIPAREFYNGCFSLEDTIIGFVRELQDRLAERGEEADRIGLVETCLWQLISRQYQADPTLEAIVKLITRTKGQIRLKNLSQELGTSYRSLDRLFWKKIGQAPKRLIQNIRFKYILEDLGKEEVLDWMQLVADHGFYDQAHFIKEFQKYTSLSPQQFVRSRQEIGRNLYS